MYIVYVANHIHAIIYVFAKTNRIKFNLKYMLQSFVEEHLPNTNC